MKLFISNELRKLTKLMPKSTYKFNLVYIIKIIKLTIKKKISEYIVHAEEFLLIYPENKLMKSYLLKLKLLKILPETYLGEFDKMVRLVYESLKEIENEAKNKAMLKLFSLAVENIKITIKNDTLLNSVRMK
jgi:hypothetical protein